MALRAAAAGGWRLLLQAAAAGEQAPGPAPEAAAAPLASSPLVAPIAAVNDTDGYQVWGVGRYAHLLRGIA